MKLMILGFFLIASTSQASAEFCGSLQHGKEGNFSLYRKLNFALDLPIIPLNTEIDNTLTNLKEYSWVCVRGNYFPEGDGRGVYVLAVTSTK
jgi:hypothetical protein